MVESVSLQKLFKTFIRPKDKDKKHSKYAPSGMDRILGCPGSTQLSEGLHSEDNEYSILGTHTHTLMEFIFKHGEKPLGHIAAKEFKEFISYSSEMHQAALVAVKHAKAVAHKLEVKNGVVPTLLVEVKSRCDELVNDDCGGTSDIVLFQRFGELHIMDYKNGRGVVEPEENKQLMTYALGILHKYGWDFSSVYLTIIQPNAKHRAGPIRTWRTSIARMERFEQELKQGIKNSKKQNAPLVLNPKWCYFCVAKNICPLQNEVKLDRVLPKFNRPKGR